MCLWRYQWKVCVFLLCTSITLGEFHFPEEHSGPASVEWQLVKVETRTDCSTMETIATGTASAAICHHLQSDHRSNGHGWGTESAHSDEKGDAYSQKLFVARFTFPQGNVKYFLFVMTFCDRGKAYSAKSVKCCFSIRYSLLILQFFIQSTRNKALLAKSRSHMRN